MTNTAQKLNQQNAEETAKLYKQTVINMARAALKQVPREDLIDILIKKKIIERDWEQNGNKYKVKDDNTN